MLSARFGFDASCFVIRVSGHRSVQTARLSRHPLTVAPPFANDNPTKVGIFQNPTEVGVRDLLRPQTGALLEV